MKDFAVSVFIGVIVGVSLILVVAWGILETGPNCPGMDPSWLGWCEEVQK